MTAQVEIALRGPDSYGLARRVVDAMETAAVWPTALNFELWTHAVTDPDGALSQEIRRLLASADPFTEATSDMLAAEYLPRGRLTDEIRDAGLVLNRELASVADAISQAHKSQTAYGETLAGAADHMERVEAQGQLQTIVTTLTAATASIQAENETLEKKLETSTLEVARLRDHLEQVRRDALTDALTNLANRKAFDDCLEAACQRAEAEDSPLTLAVLDIDHFKNFNDTWGHQTGDQVLRYVASVLGRAAKDPRIAARFGGEEFAIVFPQETAVQVETALEAIRKEIAARALRRRSTNDELGAITLSSGFARRRPGETAAALLERADAALYMSKRSGRNRVTSAERLEMSV